MDSENKRTAVGQILTIRRILEVIKDKNLPAIFTFIDFKKAFDSIHRGKMAKYLDHMEYLISLSMQ